MTNPFEDVLTVISEVKRFIKHDFRLGLPGDISDISLVCKSTLVKWQRCYYAKMCSPGQVVNELLPLLVKCEATEVSSLMSSDNHLMGWMVELKSKFDGCFEHLLDELNALTCDVVISAIGNSSTKEYKIKLEEYWSCLQIEVANKIKDLITFQENLNSRCSKILTLTEYSVFSNSPQDSTTSLDCTRYVPDLSFLSKSWDRPCTSPGLMKCVTKR